MASKESNVKAELDCPWVKFDKFFAQMFIKFRYFEFHSFDHTAMNGIVCTSFVNKCKRDQACMVQQSMHTLCPRGMSTWMKTSVTMTNGYNLSVDLRGNLHMSSSQNIRLHYGPMQSIWLKPIRNWAAIGKYFHCTLLPASWTILW